MYGIITETFGLSSIVQIVYCLPTAILCVVCKLSVFGEKCLQFTIPPIVIWFSVFSVINGSNTIICNNNSESHALNMEQYTDFLCVVYRKAIHSGIWICWQSHSLAIRVPWTLKLIHFSWNWKSSKKFENLVFVSDGNKQVHLSKWVLSVCCPI